MIHLDHNHSSSILANSPHAADQPSAVPWSSPSRDPRPFYPDSQEHASPDSSEQPALPDKPHESPSLSHTAAPSDAQQQQQQQQQQQHPPPETSPRSTTGARSPPPDSNSSLTPPPDAATEAPDDAQGQTSNTDGATMSGEAGTQATDEVDKASRQSTPLSELSSAPETAPDDENAAGDVQSKVESTSKDTDGGKADGGSSSTQQPSNMGSHSRQNSFAQGSSTSGQAVKQQGSDGSLSRQHSQASSLSPTHSKAPSLDPKVVSILELNSLLLRVSMDFQARGVPMTDQTFHQYSLRLQSNLTWLAAAADENHKVSQSLMALPIMTPPPVVEFAEMDRILHVYRELSSIFSKEIARRQQTPGPGGGLANGSMKRERTEEPGPDSVHKRRDTGETKAQTPSGFSTPGAGPSTPHPPAQLMPQVPQMNMSGGPVQRMSSPSMPPPPVPPNAMGPNEAQMAAMRARQLQMRQAQQQQAQQQAQQQQQHAESSRQMSPPANVPGMQHGGPGPSPVPTLQQLNPAQLANLQSMGPMAVQHFQVLQNPNHPFMQYLVRQIPGFMSLPTQDKLQKMQVAQSMIQARQQAQAQGGNAMGGFPQGGGMPIAPQHSGEGSPSRMSPVQQQSPMQQSFPYGGGGGGSSDPRTMFTPQQQAAIAQMNPQQRQLFLMQQQMMRGGGGGGSGGMNPQMSQQQQQMIQERMRLEQQRMQAAAGGQGVPNMGGMGGGMDGSQFPALRSNPGMPGIARSTRTPSESNPSPVSQQRMQSQDEQQQRMLMMQQAQAQAQAQQRAMSMGGGFPGGQQQGGGQGWNQNGGGQMQQQMGMGMGGQGQGAYGMVSPPGSAGGIGGGGGFPGMGGASSPAVSGNSGQMWGQGGGGGQFGGGPFMAPSPSASQHDGMTPGRGASATPGPHQHSPSADQAGLNEYDTFNWGQ